MTNHIVTYRKSRGITQKQLADLIGVSRQTIVAIENGKFNPSLTLSLKLAREFECLVEDLFQLDDRGCELMKYVSIRTQFSKGKSFFLVCHFSDYHDFHVDVDFS